jgi:RNA polymerase sigma-70 factor (ECF subfamily)
MATREEIEALIARVALADRAAFRALYSATSAKLFGVVLRILGESAEAEDVVQEVYVKVWHGAGRYAANGLSPMTWLIAIARNAAIDRLRARPRGRTQAEVPETTDPAPGPEAQAVAASERRRIEACLGELEADRAEAVRGAYLDGLSYDDLARRHGVPLNTMRTWLRRSLLKLRECLTR